jgi:hypothetical protein
MDTAKMTCGGLLTIAGFMSGSYRRAAVGSLGGIGLLLSRQELPWRKMMRP